MFIQYELVPRWYELLWDKDLPALIVGVHENVVEQLFEGHSSWPIIPRMIQHYGLRTFACDAHGAFGFDELGLVCAGYSGSYLQYRLALPTIENVSDKKCSRCNGKKRDPHFDGSCLECGGHGRERQFDWKSIRAAGLSLDLFLTRLSMVEGSTKSTVPQLLTLQTGYVSDRDMHQAPLDGAYSFPVVQWLSQQSNLETTIQAMKQAYGQMFRREAGMGGFRAQTTEEGRLSLSCPGDCACLYVDGSSAHSLEDQKGYEFCSHNVDNLGQQLTLVVGVVSLCQQVSV